MARRGPDDAAHQLSGLQLAVLRVLWRRGEARVNEVQADLASARGRTIAPTTVATLLSRLEKRGVLSHRREGRQYVYRALVSEEEISRSMVADLTSKLFAGETSELVAHLIREQDLAPGDLAQIKRLIEEVERKRGEGT